VIDYYARIAPALVPHLAGRALTFKRYPNGVEGKFFFEKRCPPHHPDWVKTAVGPSGGSGGWGSRTSRGKGTGPGDTVEYCVIDSPAALVWAANLAALELHAPMARAEDLDQPLAVVFDLDPGEPADILDCARVALQVRDVLDDLGLCAVVKTSGSKGLQVYVPVNMPITHEHAASFALAVGQLLERDDPAHVLTSMRKDIRGGKVLVDWSQNSRHKTTVSVYSLRARPRPTVSAPVAWEEVEEACDTGDRSLLSFEAGDVLARYDADGDLFEPLLSVEQELPAAAAASE
jgi:bifunctional non-homologous end joining protein LigD